MSSIPPLVDQIDFASSQKEVIVNRVNNAEAPAAIFGIKTLVALSLTVYGGALNVLGTPTTIANQTISLTDNATNYVKRTAAGVVSAVTTAPTLWPQTLAGVVALYTITTASGVATAITEWRCGANNAGADQSLMVLTPAYAASLTVDLTGNTVPSICVEVGTLTGPITFDITNGTNGQRIEVIFTQDGTGSRVFTAGAHLRFSTDTPSPVLSTAVNKIDALLFRWHSADSKAWLRAINKGY